MLVWTVTRTCICEIFLRKFLTFQVSMTAKRKRSDSDPNHFVRVRVRTSYRRTWRPRRVVINCVTGREVVWHWTERRCAIVIRVMVENAVRISWVDSRRDQLCTEQSGCVSPWLFWVLPSGSYRRKGPIRGTFAFLYCKTITWCWRSDV